MEDEKYPYQKEWREYRRRLVMFVGMFIGVLLAQLLFFYSKDYLSENTDNILGVFLVVLWVGLIVVQLRLSAWRCPRCKENYFALLRGKNLFSDFKCRNCGLKKYEGSEFRKIDERFSYKKI